MPRRTRTSRAAACGNLHFRVNTEKNPTRYTTGSSVIHSVGYHDPVYNDPILFKQPALLLRLRGNSLHGVVEAF